MMRQDPLLKLLSPDRIEFYRACLVTLQGAKIPHLIGGAFALNHYTGVVRYTKDLDVFLRPADCDLALQVLSACGYRTEITSPAWLAKAFHKDDSFVDLIFRSGNGLGQVDDWWFEQANRAKILGINVLLCPVEEMLCSKAFVMERDRFDLADIAHLLRFCAADLDWQRVLSRFGAHWRVLFVHLVLFGYIYPDQRELIPSSVLDELEGRLQRERRNRFELPKTCYGTLLSGTQFNFDVQCLGYQDARFRFAEGMSAEQTEEWRLSLNTIGMPNQVH